MGTVEARLPHQRLGQRDRTGGGRRGLIHAAHERSHFLGLPHPSSLAAGASVITPQRLDHYTEVICRDPIVSRREADRPGPYFLSAMTVGNALISRGGEAAGDILPGTDRRSVLHQFQFREIYGGEKSLTTSWNIVVKFPGTAPEGERGVILVTGHLDGLGAAQQAVDRAKGTSLVDPEFANDNATAVAAMMAYADAIQASGGHAHDIVFVITSAEEQCKLGIQAWVEQQKRQPSYLLDRISKNVNFEMLGRGDVKDLFLVAGDSSEDDAENPYYEDDLAAARGDGTFVRRGRALDPDRDAPDYDPAVPPWPHRFDSDVLYHGGIPSVTLFGGDADSGYHTDDDSFAKLNHHKHWVATHAGWRILWASANNPALARPIRMPRPPDEPFNCHVNGVWTPGPRLGWLTEEPQLQSA